MAFNIHSNLVVGGCVFGAGGITVPILEISYRLREAK